MLLPEKVKKYKPKKKKGEKQVNIGIKYREMRTAESFGKLPHEFYNAPKWSQVLAIAFFEAKQKIESYLSD